MSGHEAEDMKGRVKKAVGELADDDKLKREGDVDKASAATKEAVDKVAEKVKDVLDPKK